MSNFVRLPGYGLVNLDTVERIESDYSSPIKIFYFVSGVCCQYVFEKEEYECLERKLFQERENE